jgi:Transposase DDE domain
MGVARMVQQWTAGVNDLFCSLHGHTTKTLACFSFAMCLCSHCHSGKLAASVVSSAKPASSRRRWERLLAHHALDGSAALRELSGGMLSSWTGRKLLLVLDETPNGEDLRSLRLGVAYHHRVLNLNARCYPTDRPPMPMPKLVCCLLRQTAPLLPPDAQVTFVCDRGLAWPSVMDCVRELGWHHVLRLQRTTRVKSADGTVLAAGELVKRAGQCWHGTAQIFKKAGWRNAHVSIVWDKRAKEPWILAAKEDGARGLRAACSYAKRNWCEQSFRDEKSNGFRWDESHVHDPRRAMILVLVMTLAAVLSISLGTWLIKRGRRRDLDPHRLRRLSVFQLGMRWLHHLLTIDQDCAVPPYLPYLHPS